MDRKIELNVLKKAHKITCISNYDIEMDFGRKIDKSKCINLANGYDEADFSKISTDFNFNGPFNILHLGASGKERNPRNLFKAINKLDKEAVINPSSFRLTFVGKVETSVIDTIKYYDIFKYIHLVPYLPHKEALDFVKEASLMLLLITQSKKNIRILPGKTFEYLRSKRPIFALGPIDGEAARIINEAEVGVVLDYDNEQAIYTHLKNYYRSWHYGKKEGFIFDDVKVSNFSRQNLTKKLAEIFNNLIT